MHRPMENPYDENEERARRREYALTLRRSACAEVAHCDPDCNTDYPARVLKWQYSEGLLSVRFREPSRRFLASGDPSDISERRFEYARKLSLFLVADQVGTSVEYLRKRCRACPR